MTQEEKNKTELEAKVEEAIGWSYRDTINEYGEPMKVLDEQFLKENFIGVFTTELNRRMEEVIEKVNANKIDATCEYQNEKGELKHYYGYVITINELESIIKSLLNDISKRKN